MSGYSLSHTRTVANALCKTPPALSTRREPAKRARIHPSTSASTRILSASDSRGHAKSSLASSSSDVTR